MLRSRRRCRTRQQGAPRRARPHPGAESTCTFLDGCRQSLAAGTESSSYPLDVAAAGGVPRADALGLGGLKRAEPLLDRAFAVHELHDPCCDAGQHEATRRFGLAAVLAITERFVSIQRL